MPWYHWLSFLSLELAAARALGATGRLESEVLTQASLAFMPLADPGWWRDHVQARPNAKVRCCLRKLRQKRRRGAGQGWALGGRGDLEMKLVEAADLFGRAGDRLGLERCHELLELLALCAFEVVP